MFNYTIESSLNTDEPIMLINKHIGMDSEEGMGVDGSLFQQELLELDGMGKKRIQVWINSPGGVVMDGYNIFNAILKSNTPVDTFNVGICASIAGVIFMAGRKRVMSDYANLMMHNPFGGDDKKQLDAMKNSLITMLSAKSNISNEEVESLMQRTTWMGSSEAFDKGFCTDIEATHENNKKRMPALNAKAMWKESNLILNNIFKTENKMQKVTNKLGLNPDANEDSIVAAIEAMGLVQNKAKEDMDAMKNEVEEAKAKAKDLEEKYNKVCAEMEEAKAVAKKAEDDAQEEKCKNLIEGFAKSGKIKNESVEEWIATSKLIGHDKAKAMLEGLSVNKVANKIVEDTKISTTYNAAVIMAGIAQKTNK